MASQYRQMGSEHRDRSHRDQEAAASPGTSTLADQLKAAEVALAAPRALRLGTENTVNVSYVGDGGKIASSASGTQARSNLLDLFDESADTEFGSFYDSRSYLGFVFRRRVQAIYNQNPALPLHHPVAGHAPLLLLLVEDDQALAGTLTSPSPARADPPTGRPRPPGRWPSPRPPTAPASAATTTPSSSTSPPTTRCPTRQGGRCTWAPSTRPPSPRSGGAGEADEGQQPARARRAQRGPRRPDHHREPAAVRVAGSGVPAGPRRHPGAQPRPGRHHVQLRTGLALRARAAPTLTARQKIDSDTSMLAGAITSTATKLVVVDSWHSRVDHQRPGDADPDHPGPARRSASPRSRCSARRSGLLSARPPRAATRRARRRRRSGGPRADALYCLTAIRNSPAGVAADAQRLEVVGGQPEFLFVREDRGRSSRNGADGDLRVWCVVNATCHAQIAAFPGGSLEVVAANSSLNGSAQNIVYPANPFLGRPHADAVSGWRLHDGRRRPDRRRDPDRGGLTTTGDDAAFFVWHHAIQNSPFASTIPAGSFVVTGGASAISRGMVVVLNASAQLMTVTRSVTCGQGRSGRRRCAADPPGNSRPVVACRWSQRRQPHRRVAGVHRRNRRLDHLHPDLGGLGHATGAGQRQRPGRRLTAWSGSWSSSGSTSPWGRPRPSAPRHLQLDASVHRGHRHWVRGAAGLDRVGDVSRRRHRPQARHPLDLERRDGGRRLTPSGGAWGQTVPQTWANTDFLSLAFVYEKAWTPNQRTKRGGRG